jgi:hypothetical protein
MMKYLSVVVLLLTNMVLAQEIMITPTLVPLTQEELGTWVGEVNVDTMVPKPIVRRGLISDQTALRAACARYLAHHGDMTDLPYLINALSDESSYDGGDTDYAGKSTTRYWANVALICITKNDYGYRWDMPATDRKKSIDTWANYWESMKYKIVEQPGPPYAPQAARR